MLHINITPFGWKKHLSPQAFKIIMTDHVEPVTQKPGCITERP